MVQWQHHLCIGGSSSPFWTEARRAAGFVPFAVQAGRIRAVCVRDEIDRVRLRSDISTVHHGRERDAALGDESGDADPVCLPSSAGRAFSTHHNFYGEKYVFC